MAPLRVVLLSLLVSFFAAPLAFGQVPGESTSETVVERYSTVNVFGQNGNPHNFFLLDVPDRPTQDPRLLFAANRGDDGVELHGTYGDTQGTSSQVEDIYAGGTGSFPRFFARLGGNAIFAATTSTEGTELWTSDGFSASLLKDINVGSGDSNPEYLTRVGTTLLFFAETATEGVELWATDSTTAGTRLVKDIFPGATDFNNDGAFNVSIDGRNAEAGGLFFFPANDGVNGLELWVSNGTTAGTNLVKDITPGSDGTFITDRFASFQGKLYFVAEDPADAETKLWVSDGTAAGTQIVAGTPFDADPSPSNLYAIGDYLYLNADDALGTQKLWSYDGTTFRDLGSVVPDDDGARGRPPLMHDFNGTAFFFADDGATTLAPWVSDGTAAGTQSLAAITGAYKTKSGVSYVGNLLPVSAGERIYFQATDGSTGFELWSTDGTPSGTQLVQDFTTGSGDGEITGMGAAAGALFVGANDASGVTTLFRVTAALDVAVAPYTEDFNTDGEGRRYRTTNIPLSVFNDGPNDHFERTGGSTISTEDGPYSGFDGFFWAGEDLDDSSINRDGTVITFQPVDVSLLSQARFVGKFAAGCIDNTDTDSGCYDQGDSLSVRYSVDGGQTFQPGLKFAFVQADAIQGVFNADLAQDTDFDGVGEGTRLTPVAQTFEFDLPSGASTVILRVLADFNGSSEEFAFDDFQIRGASTVTLASPIGDQSLPALTSSTISLPDVFTETTASALTYTATSSSEGAATVEVANDLGQLTLNGIAQGTSTITVTAQNDAGDTATDSFVLTVMPPRPDFDVFTRIAPASEFCTDDTDVSTCGVIGASRFGQPRSDTLSAIGATEPVLVRYVLVNQSSRAIASSTIEDTRRGTIVSGSAVAAFDSVVVNQIYDAPSTPGLQTTRVLGEAVSPEDVATSRAHRYGIDVEAPEISVNVRIADAAEVCTDVSDLGTCSVIGESQFGQLRSDTLFAATPRDTALVRYVAVNTSETTLTSIDIEDSRYGLVLDNAPVSIAPFDSVVVNVFRPVPDEVGVSPSLMTASMRDAAGNEDIDSDGYAFEVPSPEVRMRVRAAEADQFCTDVTDVSTCGVIGAWDRFGPRSSTVDVLPGQAVLVRYVAANLSDARLKSVSINDPARNQIFSFTDAEVAPFDSVVVNRIYTAPDTSGLRLYSTTALGQDAGGNVDESVAEYGVNVTGSGLRPIVRVGDPREACSDVTDVNTCGVLGAWRFGDPRSDTLDTAPGEKTLVRYVAVNNSGRSLTEVKITDSQRGLVFEQTGLNVEPFDSVTVNTIFDAPATLGIEDNRSIVTMTATTDDAGGTATPQTYQEQDDYALNVIGPDVRLIVRTGRADRFCSDTNDAGTCTVIGAEEGSDRLETAPGERVLVRHVFENRGRFPASTVDLRDVTRDVAFFDNETVTVPGFDSLVANRIYDAPTSVGENAFRIQGLMRDAGDNSDAAELSYTLQVEAPTVDLIVRVAQASERCTDVTDVSTCGVVGAWIDQLRPRPDTLFALPAGETYLVRYVAVNRGRSPLTAFTIDDAVHGTVASPTGVNVVEFDSLVVNRIYSGGVLPGTVSSTVTAQATDLGGNLTAPSSQTYGVQTEGAAFRVRTLAGPAAFFCTNVNDASTCSLQRLDKVTSDKALAASILAKNTSDREAVAYRYFNTGTVDFVRHTLQDDVAGTVFTDSVFTVAANDSLTLFRIYDDVAPIGSGRSGTWTAVDANGDVFSATSTQAPLPVELSAFTAQVADRAVTLEWQTASEENNAGFEVQRYDDATDTWTALAFVEGEGTTSDPQAYRYAVGQLDPSVYTFRLKQVDLDGRFATSEPLEVVLGIEDAFRMTAPAPNPSRATARFQLTVREAQPVRVEVYDLLGRRVLTAFDGALPANRPQDVQLDTGRLASGSYFVRVRGTTFTTTQRLVVVQ